MDNEMKNKSDIKSKELFNMDNKTHNEKLMKEHEEKFGIKEILQILNKDKIISDDFFLFTNVVPEIKEDGSFSVKQNKWSFRSKIILNKGDVLNLNEKIETTIGRALANRVLKIDPFGAIFPYDNNPIRINKFINEATNFLMRGLITSDQIIKLLNNSIWLTRFSDMILPSMSKNVLVTPPSSVKLRKELNEKHKDILEEGKVDYIDKIEKPILEDIVKNLKDDPSFVLYESGKPSIGNHLKQSIGTQSPIFNPSTGKYDIPDCNLMTGHNPEFYHSISNMNITGTHSRAVNTEVGGAIVKTLYNSMNPMKAGPVGSDCNAIKFKIVRLTESNVSIYIWNYMIEGQALVLLTPENHKRYLNKICKFRSAMYCRYKKFEICNKCAGEIPYKTGLKSIGNMTAKVGFRFVKSSLKVFHDSTVSLLDVNPFNYMTIEEK